jgi:hypothetical protein
MNYQQNGYLSKIEHYTSEVVRLSKEIIYCHPKYVSRKTEALGIKIKKLEYFVNLHLNVCGE